MPAKQQKGKKQKKSVLKFIVDLTAPCEDNIMEASGLERFLVEHIKVDNKINNLGEKVQVASEGNKVVVTAVAPFSKRYLKYLTRKYLKKQQLRDWLRVVASDKQTYTVKYFSIQEDDGEEEAEE